MLNIKEPKLGLKKEAGVAIIEKVLSELEEPRPKLTYGIVARRGERPPTKIWKYLGPQLTHYTAFFIKVECVNF